MTGYHIEIGYNAGGSLKDEGKRWETLKKEARNIADNPKAIIAEARKLGAPETCDDGCCHLDTYADNYAEPFGSYGHPISIIEDNQQIMQLAGAADRIKYHVRRAYVRLLFKAMHKHEIEINLIVA
uniref:Uncharacterized protein n=1 Tax=viral metagenome TaxID=1070528 RepID=A0A6H2A5K7_9ZZZZ